MNATQPRTITYTWRNDLDQRESHSLRRCWLWEEKECGVEGCRKMGLAKRSYAGHNVMMQDHCDWIWAPLATQCCVTSDGASADMVRIINLYNLLNENHHPLRAESFGSEYYRPPHLVQEQMQCSIALHAHMLWYITTWLRLISSYAMVSVHGHHPNSKYL